MTAFTDWMPQGVIPAVLLLFKADFNIDERAYRKHLRYVVAIDGISAITVNGHSCEVHACTADEQTREAVDSYITAANKKPSEVLFGAAEVRVCL